MWVSADLFPHVSSDIAVEPPYVGSVALAANNGTEPYKQPKIEEMNYVLLTDAENISIPITESIKLWRHEKFDATKDVVIMVTGWNSDIDAENTAASSLWAAYRSRGDTNFVLIDTARYVDTLYAWSAFNTQELGKGLGKGIAELINVVPLDKIHLMGHSLGLVDLKTITESLNFNWLLRQGTHCWPGWQDIPNRDW